MKLFIRLTPLLLSLLLVQGCSDIISATRSEPIDEDPGRLTAGEEKDDAMIETHALVNLDKASPDLANANIIVVSYNGIVLLAGQVGTDQLRQQAAGIVNKVSRKVRRVHNELTITGQSSMVARSNDSWITTKLKSKMMANSAIESDRIKVVTENGVVYLMGLVTQDEGQRASDMARTTGGVQKVVVIFEYIASPV